eukprot:m.72014 g.72014  ORF g.72014 m.72014 type:complete len:149 (+) comp50215_c0_seq2:115-561(+)
MTLDELQVEYKRLLVAGQIPKAPDAKTMDKYIRMLTLKNKAHNAYATVYNYTLGWIWENKPYEPLELPLNTGKLMDLMVKVYAHQLFHDGLFNGDPHPGNFILLPDGRLGLIDFGQVKQLTEIDRSAVFPACIPTASVWQYKFFGLGF